MAYILQSNSLSSKDAAVELFRRPVTWFVSLFALWWILLGVFYAFPQIDLWAAKAFFRESGCALGSADLRTCGYFPAAREPVLIFVRKFYFYVPIAVAMVIILLMIRNFQHHGATYDATRTRRYSVALLSSILGPYLLVNLILKTISGRPRPYETDLFGGTHAFASAGTLDGSCLSNCSFISGEAAGAGWLACLIVLLPPRLRVIFGPVILMLCLVSPYLRVAFGGHYLSDVTLGFLSSCVVYAAVAVYYETQKEKNRWSKTAL